MVIIYSKYSGSVRCLFSKKATFQLIFGQNYEHRCATAKKPNTDFLFEIANILSEKPGRTICSKIKKKPTF